MDDCKHLNTTINHNNTRGACVCLDCGKELWMEVHFLNTERRLKYLETSVREILEAIHELERR